MPGKRIITFVKTTERCQHSEHLRKYVPELELQHIFKETLVICGLDDSYIDDVRKIFFLWFQLYHDYVNHSHDVVFPAINFPGVGKLLPDSRVIKKRIDIFCEGNLIFNQTTKAALKKFERLLRNYKLIYSYFSKYLKYNDYTTQQQLDRNIKKYSVTWSGNLEERGVNSRKIRDIGSIFGRKGLFL